MGDMEGTTKQSVDISELLDSLELSLDSNASESISLIATDDSYTSHSLSEESFEPFESSDDQDYDYEENSCGCWYCRKSQSEGLVDSQNVSIMSTGSTSSQNSEPSHVSHSMMMDSLDLLLKEDSLTRTVKAESLTRSIKKEFSKRAVKKEYFNRNPSTTVSSPTADALRKVFIDFTLTRMNEKQRNGPLETPIKFYSSKCFPSTDSQDASAGVNPNQRRGSLETPIISETSSPECLPILHSTDSLREYSILSSCSDANDTDEESASEGLDIALTNVFTKTSNGEQPPEYQKVLKDFLSTEKQTNRLNDNRSKNLTFGEKTTDSSLRSDSNPIGNKKVTRNVLSRTCSRNGGTSIYKDTVKKFREQDGKSVKCELFSFLDDRRRVPKKRCLDSGFLKKYDFAHKAYTNSSTVPSG